MYCKKCGRELSDGARYCCKCGTIKKSNKKNNERIKKNKLNKKTMNNKSIILIAVFSVTLLIIAGVVGYNNKPSIRYKKAEKAFLDENYDKAIELYYELGTYKDSEEKLECAIKVKHYYDGIAFYENEQYDEALIEFEQTVGYENTSEMIDKCNYNKACICMENGQYVEASNLFKQSNYYEDSNKFIEEMGINLTEEGNYSDAIIVFDNGTLYNNKYAKYSNGMVELENKNYGSATIYFSEADGLLDAEEKYKESKYLDAEEYFCVEDYEIALNLYADLNDYNDSEDKYEICKLMLAKELYDEGSLNEAKISLNEVKNGTSYNGVCVEALLDNIEENAEWLPVCGRWKCTNGQLETKQEGTYGYYNSWFRDVTTTESWIEIRCKINEDGSVTVVTEGYIPIYTNYSSISAYLIESKKSLSSSSNMESLETISVDNYTTVDIYDSKIIVQYKKIDQNVDVYFDYIYTTYVVFEKEIVE